MTLTLKVSFRLTFSFSLFSIVGWEFLIFTENGIIEMVSALILASCLLLCGRYAIQSRLKQGGYFWVAASLVFVTVIRRELNHLPDRFISESTLLLSHNYDWWEDRMLLVIYIVAVGFLIYAWRYCWLLLKTTSVWLYLCVAALAVLQYTGENAIGFSHDFGVIVEELSETIIYLIALGYLWSFKLSLFDHKFEQNFKRQEVVN